MVTEERFVWVCGGCGKVSDLPEFLDDCSGYWPELQAVRHRCATCGAKAEVQLLWCEVRVGYSYAAGSPHFAAMESIPAPGLVRQRGEDCVTATFEGRSWVFRGP